MLGLASVIPVYLFAEVVADDHPDKQVLLGLKASQLFEIAFEIGCKFDLDNSY